MTWLKTTYQLTPVGANGSVGREITKRQGLPCYSKLSAEDS
jgi:hypothetical protein